MKRLIAIFLTLVIIASVFTACTNTQKAAYPLTVNSTPIDGEIFRYYLDAVWDSEEAAGTKDGRIDQATYMCIRYVAVNSTFLSYSLSLTDAEKAELSAQTNVLWDMFGEYYGRLGISKETYLKIRTNEEYIEKLRLYFYDKGGTQEISDAVLRGVLQENFISFRYVRTPDTNTDVYGNAVSYTDEELQRLTSLYSSAVSTVAPSYGIDKAYSQISPSFPLTEKSYETEVIDRNDHEFSSVFYDTVKTMTEGTGRIFQYDGYIYLVYRTNILTEPEAFSELRGTCLKMVSEEPLQSTINMMCNAYQSVRDPVTVGEYYKEVGNCR